MAVGNQKDLGIYTTLYKDMEIFDSLPAIVRQACRETGFAVSELALSMLENGNSPQYVAYVIKKIARKLSQ